jgi:hypothetical protein
MCTNIINILSGQRWSITAQINTETGYNPEIALSCEAILCIPKTGQYIGFDLQVNDNDGKGRKCKISWKAEIDNSHQSPSVFGTLKLGSIAAGQPGEYKEVTVYLTAKATSDLLANQGLHAFEPMDQPDENYPAIMIDVDKTFQTIEGFGGAFTDASAINFAKLSQKNQEELLKACFDPDEGNAYTLCRTTIHSSI